MFSGPLAEVNDFRAMVREAAKLLPVHPVVHGNTKLRRVSVLGAEIEMNYRRRMLTISLVPLPGEDKHSLPLRDFCLANVRRPFSLDDVEQVVERVLRIATPHCDAGIKSSAAPGHRAVLLQEARKLIDIEQINRETIALLNLDADVLAIAELLPIFGIGGIDGHWYSKVWQEIESLRELLHHTPNLLPLGYGGLVNGCWWGGSDILREIKSGLRQAGLSKNGWRDLIKLPRQTINALMPAFPVGETIIESFAAAFSVYRLAREEGPPGFSEHLLHKAAGSLHELPAGAIRIMAQEVRVRAENGVIQDFFDDDFTAVCTWLREEEPRLTALRNRGWRGLVECARIYKSDMFGPMESDMPRNLSWESALPEHEDAGFLFVPLISSEALREEGEIMKHCVAQYDADCASGKSRIFSVRSIRTGRRVATVELHIDDLRLGKKWFVGQIKGAQNSNVGIRVKSSIKKLAKRYAVGNPKVE